MLYAKNFRIWIERHGLHVAFLDFPCAPPQEPAMLDRFRYYQRIPDLQRAGKIFQRDYSGEVIPPVAAMDGHGGLHDAVPDDNHRVPGPALQPDDCFRLRLVHRRQRVAPACQFLNQPRILRTETLVVLDAQFQRLHAHGRKAVTHLPPLHIRQQAFRVVPVSVAVITDRRQTVTECNHHRHGNERRRYLNQQPFHRFTPPSRSAHLSV